MKKYDLILGGVYVIPVILAFVVFYALKYPSSREIKKAEAYFEELKKQSVKTVVIRETSMNIKVFETPDKLQKSFDLTGAMPLDHVKHWRVVQDTLFIEGRQGSSPEGNLKLRISSGVKVDTLNAPWVMISKVKVEGNTTTNEF